MTVFSMTLLFVFVFYCFIAPIVLGNSGRWSSVSDYRTDLAFLHVARPDPQSVNSFSSVVTVPAEDIVSDCQAVIKEFADEAANFTKCSLSNARPLRLCEQCYRNYHAAMVLYRALRHDIKDCGEFVINGDEVQVILQTGDFLNKVWDDGNCMNCFNPIHDKNDSTPWIISNYTTSFWQHFNSTWKCFINNTPGSVIPLHPTRNVTNSTACTDCLEQYQSMSSYYHHLEDVFNYRLCMDIVDAMNYTRQFWSDTLHCLHDVNHILAITVFSLMLSTVVAFYIVAFVISRKDQLENEHTLHDPSVRPFSYDTQTSLSSVSRQSSYEDSSPLFQRGSSREVHGDL